MEVILVVVLNPLQLLKRTVKSFQTLIMAVYVYLAPMPITAVTMVTSGLEVTTVLVGMVTGQVMLLVV